MTLLVVLLLFILAGVGAIVYAHLGVVKAVAKADAEIAKAKIDEVL